MIWLTCFFAELGNHVALTAIHQMQIVKSLSLFHLEIASRRYGPSVVSSALSLICKVTWEMNSSVMSSTSIDEAVLYAVWFIGRMNRAMIESTGVVGRMHEVLIESPRPVGQTNKAMMGSPC